MGQNAKAGRSWRVAYATQDAVHQDGLAGDGAVGENGPVRGDPRDAQARTGLVAHLIRQVHRLPFRDVGQLRRGPGRPVGLGTVHPYPAADPGRVRAFAG
jgi:hypothetical protein